MAGRLHLPQRYRRILEALLREHVPDAEVWAYGSRVIGESHDGCDLDLVVRGPELKPLGDGFFQLVEAIEKSNIPILVQAHDWARLPESFHREIEKDYDVLAKGEPEHVVGKRIYHRLEDLMAAIIDYRGKTPPKTSSGVPLITAKIVKEGRIKTPTEFIAAEDYTSWMRRGIPRSGDIVVTSEAPLGEVAQLSDQRVALAQRVILLRGKPGILDNRFLKFLMQSEDVQDQMRARASGTTVLGIKQKELRQIELALPSISEQRAIAHVLGTLDDKIELSRRMNETLEEMARALFKAWFVDFLPVRAKQRAGTQTGDPVRAKAALKTSSAGGSDWTVERARAYLDSMDKSVVDLFPDRLVESELGEIPEGWEVKALGALAELNPPEPMKRGALAPYLDMAALPTAGSSPEKAVLREFKSGTRFRNGDTLLARITPCLENGKTAFVQSLETDVVGWGSTEFIVLRAVPPVAPEYTYLLARDAGLRDHAIQSMTGTSGRQRVQVDALAPYLLPSPTTETWNGFSELVSPLFAQIELNRKESLALTVQRDTLLPRLISGEVRAGIQELSFSLPAR